MLAIIMMFEKLSGVGDYISFPRTTECSAHCEKLGLEDGLL